MSTDTECPVCHKIFCDCLAPDSNIHPAEPGKRDVDLGILGHKVFDKGDTLLHPLIVDVREYREYHGLDTANEVFFYEQEFYVLSNFSAFSVQWFGARFATAEHVYQSERFRGADLDAFFEIKNAVSAHEAFTLAQRRKQRQRKDWSIIKVQKMREMLAAKVTQHDYVKRKLLETGDRQLIENSWRDDFWGWGPQRDGHNMLGNLWMDVRSQLRRNLPLDQSPR